MWIERFLSRSRVSTNAGETGRTSGGGERHVDGTKEVAPSEARLESLNERLNYAKKRRHSRTQTDTLGSGVGLLLIAVGIAIMVARLGVPKWYGPTAVIAGSLYLTIPLLTGGYRSYWDNDIQQIESEIELLELTDQSIEQRSYRLFKLHQIELKRYYDQTLSQSRIIFIVGIGCIVAGLSVVGATIFVLSTSMNEGTLGQQVIIGSVGAVGGILANFVAAIYLRMYGQTVQSLALFHNRLVITHHLHFANFLASKIDDDTLREHTLGIMASAISQPSGHTQFETASEIEPTRAKPASPES
jgi:hypothetical protein